MLEWTDCLFTMQTFPVSPKRSSEIHRKTLAQERDDIALQSIAFATVEIWMLCDCVVVFKYSSFNLGIALESNSSGSNPRSCEEAWPALIACFAQPALSPWERINHVPAAYVSSEDFTLLLALLAGENKIPMEYIRTIIKLLILYWRT